MTLPEDRVGRDEISFSEEFKNILDIYASESFRFLEWGTGPTTEIICHIAKTRRDPFVLTIDNDRNRQLEVASNLPFYNFLHIRTFNLIETIELREDTEPTYSSYPFLMGLKFDVIFINGLRRFECALTALHVAAHNAIIIVHNRRPSRYQIMATIFETIVQGQHFIVLRPKAVHEFKSAKKAERRVILVPARGARAMKELNITWPYTKAYANAVGADCRVIGGSSKLPPHRLKFEAVEHARQYDRVLLLDADVLIRPGSPDIFDLVPPEALGAFAEGRYFQRKDWCDTINELYKCNTQVTANDYFNSGVLILSSDNIILLESLGLDIVYGHPQFEQGFLNAKRAALNLPLFHLSPDFNYIPNVAIQPCDWRFSFFYHPAGSGKSKYLYEWLWEDKTGGRNTYSLRRLLSADVRCGILSQASEQMKGNDVRIFDPTDHHYIKGFANAIFTEMGQVVAYFPPMNFGADRHLCVHGPYTSLSAGRWRVRYLNADLGQFVFAGAYFEVTKCNGEIALFGADWSLDGSFEFVLEDQAENVEFRIYRPSAAAEFSYLRLEKC